MKPTTSLSSICCAIAASFLFSQGFSQAPRTEILSGQGISVKSYNFEGFQHLLAKNTDTTYVVNFWATWCAPCIKELPHFEQLSKNYKGRKLKVLLVSLDSKKQVEKSLIPFIKRRKLASEVVLLADPDMNAWIPKVDAGWSGAIPATLIYNSSRNFRRFYERSFSYEELESEVKPNIL